MILRLLQALLLPDRTPTMAELQRKAEDGSITMLELTRYLDLLDKMNKVGDHANRVARSSRNISFADLAERFTA